MRVPIVLLSAVVLSACARVPYPVTYPLNTQQKMQAAHHWDVLACEVVEEVGLALETQGYECETPIHIVTGGHSPFSDAFHGFLTTRLLEEGLCASYDKSAPLKLYYDAQVVEHRGMRNKHFPLGGTLLGTLRAAALQGKEGSPFEETVIGAGFLWDLYEGGTTRGLPGSEVIITTILTESDSVVMRRSQAYYINDRDTWHYPQHSQRMRFVGVQQPLAPKMFMLVQEQAAE